MRPAPGLLRAKRRGSCHHQIEDDPIPLEEFARNLAAESAGQQLVFESVMTVAHPSLFNHYEVYDLKTAKRLEIPDLLEPGKLDAIRALAKVDGDFPNEPEIGLLKAHAVYRPDPYANLKGILKPQFLP